MIKFTMFLFLFKSKFKVKRRWWSLENLLSVIFVINVFCISPSEGAELANCDKGCFNGDCIHTRGKGGEEDSYKCECWEGWRGEKCELCGGKVKLRENGSQTWLAEAVGNYTINMKVKYFYQTFLPNIFYQTFFAKYFCPHEVHLGGGGRAARLEDQASHQGL